jgi:cephalosporin-C deacetylase
MPQFDLPLTELQRYSPELAVPDDFDAFWERTLRESRAASAAPVVEPVDSPLAGVAVHDLTFSGFAGDAVKAWLITPAGTEGPLPTVVEFLGYRRGRGLPHEWLAWASAGYAHVVMDTRGQGSLYASGGVTPDPHGTGPTVPGFLTRGIESADDHYYRRVFTDAVLCVEAAATLPMVDAARIVVAGTSQGGGIALAAAGLLGDRVAATLADVPFLCHIDRAITLTDREPYAELARYLAAQRDRTQQVLRTLAYLDAANHSARATAPALFSVGLFDATCPPSTVYAAFNRYGGERKQIDVYPFNDHEGGGPFRWPAQADFLDRALTSGRPSSAVGAAVA